MDPVTHGIAGALIGKAFFADRCSGALTQTAATHSLLPREPSSAVYPAQQTVRTAHVAVIAAVLGAVFPDVDVFAEAFSHDPLAIARYHRGFTHSFVGLPIFAAALAWLTLVFFRWYSKRPGDRDWTPPSFGVLLAIYATGIASHILLDGLTSFGTRMFNPFSKGRVAWDLLFIIDFAFTALLLAPQLAAWVHGSRDKARRRAGAIWSFLSIVAVAIWALARAAAFPFSFGAVIMASAIFAVLFYLPIHRRSGLPFSRAGWCRVGFALACAYVVAAGIAHHAAMSRVRSFAENRHIAAEKMGAMPLPDSLFRWNGLILTRGGVYQSIFSLGDSAPEKFKFWTDSPPNSFTQEATQIEPVRTYLWYARFPVMNFTAASGKYSVWYTDLRFFTGVEHPMPFRFYVSFDSDGQLLNYGWVARGARFERTAPTADVP